MGRCTMRRGTVGGTTPNEVQYHIGKVCVDRRECLETKPRRIHWSLKHVMVVRRMASFDACAACPDRGVQMGSSSHRHEPAAAYEARKQIIRHGACPNEGPGPRVLLSPPRLGHAGPQPAVAAIQAPASKP